MLDRARPDQAREERRVRVLRRNDEASLENFRDQLPVVNSLTAVPVRQEPERHPANQPATQPTLGERRQAPFVLRCQERDRETPGGEPAAAVIAAERVTPPVRVGVPLSRAAICTLPGRVRRSGYRSQTDLSARAKRKLVRAQRRPRTFGSSRSPSRVQGHYRPPATEPDQSGRPVGGGRYQRPLHMSRADRVNDPGNSDDRTAPFRLFGRGVAVTNANSGATESGAPTSRGSHGQVPAPRHLTPYFSNRLI